MGAKGGSAPLRVVVVGGGVAALELVVALRRFAEDRVAIEVVAPDAKFVYRPLAVAEPFGLASARAFDFDRLLAGQGARRRAGVARSVDTAAATLTTEAGESVAYDALAIATGAKPVEAVPGALTIGLRDSFARLGSELKRLEPGARVVYAVPSGTAWSLPLYELALMTATAHPEVKVTVATPEQSPLGVFGRRASDVVAGLLDERGIELHTGLHPIAVENGALRVTNAPAIEGTLFVAMAALRGPAMSGLPSDRAGFIPVDQFCRVRGLDGIWAAGDATSFPVKQGGLAAQQAVVVAEDIAARAGAPLEPRPFEPVLRGLLLTGSTPEYLRAELKGGRGEHTSEADVEPIWWPPGKIASEHSSHLLAQIAASEPLPGEDPFLRIETDDLEDLLRRP